jgi:hypothetical protein
VKKGYCKNAELGPLITASVRETIQPGEEVIVKIIAKTGDRYWLTDRRILMENQNAITTLFRYEAISHVHWMFKDLTERVKAAVRTGDPEQISRMKSEHFDRLEVEFKNRDPIVVLEGLDQAYSPLLSSLRFFR